MIQIAPAIAKHWKLIGVGVLVVALALTYAWGSAGWRKADQHKTAHEQTIRDYKTAQEQAQKKFDAQIAEFQAQNRRLNNEIDRKANDVAIVYRDRVIRLPAAPAQCAAGGSDMPATGAAQRGDSPSGDSVLLTRSDALICADNTARLLQVKEWGEGLRSLHADSPQ